MKLRIGIVAVTLLFVLGFSFGFCGCSNSVSTAPEEIPFTEAKKEVPSKDDPSPFTGTWICLRENSCNNMRIVLNISQENDRLHIVRDMESNTSSGSKISFSVAVPANETFYASDTRGTYTLKDGILTESFDGGKVNYFSATGIINVRICAFPFCSRECESEGYCTDHDTEEERYNSLTDGNKKSIGYFIDGRYDYYDQLNGGYSGDKYSDEIMGEAAAKYGLTIEHIKIIWMKFYSY